jgi:hypothetical protein
MAYADLTADEKHQLQDWLEMFRLWCRAQAGANNNGSALDLGYNNGISVILGKLSAEELIPNEQEHKFAGSASLTPTEVVLIVSHWQNIIANYGTIAHRGIWSRGCGAPNMV